MKLHRPFYGWWIILVGALIAFSSGPGQSYVFSVFLDSIIEDSGLTRTTVSAIYTAGTGLSALMVLLVSRLADRFGPRVVVTLVAFGVGVVCFGMAFATGALAFFVFFAALRALGQGSLPINATLLTAQWFVRRRGRAMALMGLGFAFSNALLPPFARWLIDAFDWRDAYMVLGVMVWILVIPAALLVVRDTPEQLGLHPDGAPEAPEFEPGGAPLRPGERDHRKIFSTSTFWLLALPMATPGLVITALVFHQTSIFEERGLSANLAAGVFVAYSIASAGISLAAGLVIDRLGPKKIFAAGMLFLFLGTVLAGVIATPAQAALYAAILGLSGGVQQLVSGVTWAHFYGRRGLGRVQGAAATVTITGAAIGPLPLAAMHSLTGSYTAGLVLLATLPILAAVTISFARPQRLVVETSVAVVPETAG